MSVSYPGNLAADIEGRLAVSDTGHHRILFGRIVGNSYDVQRVIGRGEPGFVDGALEEAEFREPQGLVLSGDMLIVADRGNHAIRMVDMGSGEVGTMAGTGDLAEGAMHAGDPLETPLCSPWDVLLHHYDLFIAMAGPRQIWRLDLKEKVLVPHAGADAEQIVDAPSGPARARPMGLATDEEMLYFADAESSSINRVSFQPGGEVQVLVGTGRSDTGDSDGVGDEVRLQHPAGLAWGQGNHRLWMTDSHNSKLKTLDPARRQVETVEPFDADLAEPMGLSSAGHMLYLADTKHHRILRVDQIDKRVTELAIEGIA